MFFKNVLSLEITLKVRILFTHTIRRERKRTIKTRSKVDKQKTERKKKKSAQFLFHTTSRTFPAHPQLNQLAVFHLLSRPNGVKT